MPLSSNFPASLPPWRPDAKLSELYDMTTVRGRLSSTALTNPLELLVSYAEIERRAAARAGPTTVAASRAVARARVALAAMARRGLLSEPRAEPVAADDAAMWTAHARRTRRPLGEVVAPPFRTAGWATFGVVPVGWLTPPRRTAALPGDRFRPVVNQTHLAGSHGATARPTAARPTAAAPTPAGPRSATRTAGRLLRGYGAACCGACRCGGRGVHGQAVPALRFIAPYAPFPGVDGEHHHDVVRARPRA